MAEQMLSPKWLIGSSVIDTVGRFQQDLGQQSHETNLRPHWIFADSRGTEVPVGVCVCPPWVESD
eukprot:COSAG01_NODE_4137_length_5306_cov_35.681390_6_plen_65_part_00